MTTIDDALRQVIDNELRLLRPEVRNTASEVERLLHPDFVEFGASGRRWSRDDMVAAIGSMFADDDAPTAREVEAVRLAESVVLVTYVTEGPRGRARRSSVWRKASDGAWQVYFHQGTPVTTSTDVGFSDA